MTTKTILLNDLRIDGQTQARVSVNLETVAHYAEMEEHELPPIIVFFDGVNYWLADGFHRYHAAVSRGKKSNIVADVRKGTQRDAVLFSLNANVSHGLSLTSEDKRNAVLIMLNDPEWCELSNHAIARHCGCSHMTVGRLRNGDPEPAKPVATGTSSTASTKPLEQCSKLIVVDEAHCAGTSSKTEPPSKTEKQLEAEQIAQDAHGESDPIAMLEEAQKQIESLQGELFALQADDQKAETLKFKRIADIATRRQNELMDTVNARERELQKQANWLRRIGVALGEDDNSKLPALVEALKRGSK